MLPEPMQSSIFFFNDTATTEIYTLSLHDALPIWRRRRARQQRGVPDDPRDDRGDPRRGVGPHAGHEPQRDVPPRDRKSTRLNSSHANISYAVFCLKKNIEIVRQRDAVPLTTKYRT